MKYKAIIFDIDGTLTRLDNPWKHIHDCCNTWNSSAFFYKEAFSERHITYSEFCKLEARCFKGLPSNKVYEMFRQIETPKNLHENLKDLKEFGFKLIAISSGLQFIPEILDLSKFFDFMVYNELPSVNGFLSGDIKVNVDYKKLINLDFYIEKCNLRYDEIIFVGDGENDIFIAEKVGYSVAFNSNSENLKKAVNFAINSLDFGEIAEHLKGISLEITSFGDRVADRRVEIS